MSRLDSTRWLGCEITASKGAFDRALLIVPPNTESDKASHAKQVCERLLTAAKTRRRKMLEERESAGLQRTPWKNRTNLLSPTHHLLSRPFCVFGIDSD